MTTNNIVLLFPGQGAQYTGMGSSFRTDPLFQEIFSIADQTLPFSLSRLCLEGPEEELKLTEKTQPAILCYSYFLYRKLLQSYPQIQISLVLGHSVGEYCALVAAGVLDFREALLAVHYRGKFMQESVPVGEGKMLALLKVPETIVIEGCRQASTSESKVMPANFNEPQQIVVSGHADACDRLKLWLEKNCTEKFRAIELSVSAPFHSSLMESAAAKMQVHFQQMNFLPNKIPYLANVNAQIIPVGSDPKTIQQYLIQQIPGSVLWTQSMQQVPENALLFEVGPGTVLKNLAKKINPSLQVFDLDRPDFVEKVRDLF